MKPVPGILIGQQPMARRIIGLQEESTTIILSNRYCKKRNPDDLLDPIDEYGFHPSSEKFLLTLGGIIGGPETCTEF